MTDTITNLYAMSERMDRRASDEAAKARKLEDALLDLTVAAEAPRDPFHLERSLRQARRLVGL